MVISEQIQIYWCFHKKPTPVSDLANNMRFRCNVLISVNCVSINTDPYKNYYATFKREYWHASVHWLYNLKFINCSTKKLLQGLGDVLFVSYSYGAANVDHAKSLKINNKYNVCQLYLASVGDKIAKPDKVAETHMYTTV